MNNTKDITIKNNKMVHNVCRYYSEKRRYG